MSEFEVSLPNSSWTIQLIHCYIIWGFTKNNIKPNVISDIQGDSSRGTGHVSGSDSMHSNKQNSLYGDVFNCHSYGLKYCLKFTTQTANINNSKRFNKFTS